MSLRAKLGRAVVVLALAGLPARGAAQEHPVQRVANIVSVAIEEYKKGIDGQGRVISTDEYQEAIGFLDDARLAAARLPRDRALAASPILDSIIAAVAAKHPPGDIDGLGRRFSAVLGSEAALSLPTKALDLAEGKRLYEANCTSCHGALGMGDGPAGAVLDPKPAAVGSSDAMAESTPATAFRKISVGVTGTGMPPFETLLTPEQRWNIVMYLGELQHSAQMVAGGEGLYTRDCVSCHGMTGLGDGAVARTLSTLPPELGSFAWQVERSDSQMVAAIRDGRTGTPMPPATNLSAAQIHSVVAYLRTLPARQRTLATTSDRGKPSSEAVGRNSISLLDQSIAAALNRQPNEAADLAFDAYMAFEPIESPARARNPGVVSSMERLYTEFKVAVRENDLGGARQARNAIEASMPKVVELTKPAGSGREAFLQSFLIILREGFEAILVIGAVVAFLLKTGNRERLRSIWIGIAAALVASALTAIVLRTVLKAIPASQEIIEGLTLLVAVCVLFSVSYWLISRVEAAKWQQFIREKVNTALNHGGGRALAFVAFLAVYREGAETALFYQALFNEGSNVVLPITLGIIVGFAALAVIFTLFYRFGVRIPLRPFFSVTSVLLYYMAFVFTGTGIRELQEGNALPITVIPGIPTIEALGLYPTLQTIGAQFVLLALFVFAVAKTFWPKRSVTLPTVAPVAPVAPADPESTLGPQLAQLRAETAELRDRLAKIETAMGKAAEAVHASARV